MKLSKEEKENYFKKLKRSASVLLWEYDIKKLSNKDIEDLLKERVMQFGNMKQIRLMMKVFSYNELALFFASKAWRNFSNIDFNFWYLILKDYKKKEIDWNQLFRQRQSVRNKYVAWNH